MEYVHERFRRLRRKMVACSLVLLVEDNEREVKREKTWLWLKRRQEKGYFANIVQELAGYREMFRMKPADFYTILLSFLVISLSFYRIQIARHFPPCLQMTFKKASAHA